MISAREMQQRVKTGQSTALDTLDACLKTISSKDNGVGAFLSILDDRAREKAAKIDAKRNAGKSLGKLAGVPIAIKDNIHIRGEITSCASKFLDNYTALFDATVIRLLEAEDAVLIGKTNLDEFAMGSSTENSALKKTQNPWNLSKIPGGSSGGSAAAVSARMCPLSLGSDTGGSIRQPAALCGVVGFKPTYGRVSRYGLVAFGSSLDQIGPFSLNVEDAALCMDVIGTHCERDSTSLNRPCGNYLDAISQPIEGRRIGVPWKFLEGMDPECRRLFDASIEVYKNMGCTIVDLDLSILNAAIGTYYILATAEASTNLARFDGVRYGQRSKKAESLQDVYDYSKQEGFGPEVKRRIMLGTFVLSAGYRDAYYKKAQKVRRLIIDAFRKVFTIADVVLTPTTPTAAFERGSHKDPITMYQEDIFTIPANLSGLPGISIPGGFTAEGMPVGLQIMGPQQRDATVLQMAHAFEKATAFHKEPPQNVGGMA